MCKSKGATRHHHHHPAVSLSLLISLSNRDVCALGADIETLSLSLQRNGRTRTKKKAPPPPWRSTTQTSRKARKVRRTLFFDQARARRSIGFDLSSLFCSLDTSLTDHAMCDALDRLTHRQPDVRKQIFAGRETDRRRGTRCCCFYCIRERFFFSSDRRTLRVLDERKRSKIIQIFSKRRRRSPRIPKGREKLTFDVLFFLSRKSNANDTNNNNSPFRRRSKARMLRRGP